MATVVNRYGCHAACSVVAGLIFCTSKLGKDALEESTNPVKGALVRKV